MLKLVPLVISSVLCVPAIATAKPLLDLDFRATASLGFEHADPSPVRVLVRDHRYPRPAEPSRPHKLGSVGTGTQQINGSDARFDTLYLEVDGAVYLDHLVIQFDDQQYQRVNFRKTLTARLRPVTIDLAGNARKVTRIIVHSKDDRRGVLSVFAARDAHAPPPVSYGNWMAIGTVAAGAQELWLRGNDRLTRIALAATGPVHLQRVLIQYEDGRRQFVDFDRALDSRSRPPIIELERRRDIKRIVVYTNDDARGEVTLLGL